jgi:tetratricopeptide (TPR) repeat protein
MVKKLFLLLLFLILECKSTAERRIEGNSELDKFEIRGFKQFQIYTSRNLLGYIPANGQISSFDKKLWRGKIIEDPIQQTIIIRYTIEDIKEMNAGFSEIFSGAAGFENIKSIQLHLENPVQYTLEDIKIDSNFKTQKDLFENKYIGSVLKVDKIKIDILNKEGINLKTEADLKINSIKLGANVKLSSSENSLFFAENAFIGYKLFDPPSNIDSYISEKDTRTKIVVFPFELEGTKNKDDKLKSALAEASSRSLNQIENIYVLDRNSYQKILEESELGKTDSFDTKNAIKVGQLMTANTIFLGKFSREGLDARITSQMIDVDTGSIQSQGQIKYDLSLRGKSTPQIADEWENKILESFGIKNSKKDKVSILGTNTSEAFDQYRKGREKFILLDEESLEEAIPYFKKAIELDSNYTEAYANLAESYMRLYEYRNFRGDRFGAEKYKLFGLENVTKAFEIQPNSALANRVFSFYYFYIEIDFEKSKNFALKATELDPKDAESAIRYFIVKNRENPKALSPENQELKSIYDSNPNLISTNFYLAQSYRKSKDYENAILYLKKILEISPKNLSMYSEISSIYVEQEKWKEALDWLEKADEIAPNQFQVQVYLANYYIKRKEYTKANEYIQITKKLEPKSTIPYELLANLAIKQNNLEEAISLYQKCIELDSKRGAFLSNIGTLYNLKKQKDIAIQYYKKAIKLEPKLVIVYEKLANILLEKNQFDEAIQLLEKSLELENTSYRNRILADAYILKEEPDLALKYYNIAQELDPTEFMIYYEQGHALYLRKDFYKAKEKFEKALELGKEEVKSFAFKGLGDLARKEKNYDKAIEFYNKSIQQDDTNFISYIDMANCYSKKKNNTEAIRILKTILEKEPKQEKAIYTLGKIYKEEGRMLDSKDSFQKSCELGYQKSCDELNGVVKKKKKKLI